MAVMDWNDDPIAKVKMYIKVFEVDQVAHFLVMYVMQS